MCRYSDKNYKTSFACFKHRHAAKFPMSGPAPLCPTCREPMHHMGRDFKPPKKTDVKAWKKLEARWYPGIFNSCGC